MESHGGVRQYFRLQDILWLFLFAALAIFGPDRTPVSVTVLIGLGGVPDYRAEGAVPDLMRGIVVSLHHQTVTLVVLIGQTDGIVSSYYFV